MSLPYNFDGDALLRYIEDVQLAAKQEHRSQLINASAMKKAKEHEALARQHDKELLIAEENGITSNNTDNDNDSSDIDNNNFQKESSSSSNNNVEVNVDKQQQEEQEEEQREHEKRVTETDINVSHRSNTDKNEQAQHDKLRAMYRRTNPHLEEYLVSSPHTVDPLSVERPLTHAVHFNSHAEAADQLK